MVFRTTRSDRPDTTHDAPTEQIAAAKRTSRAACVNACGPIRAQGASVTSTRACVIAPPTKCLASRAANASGSPIGVSLANA